MLLDAIAEYAQKTRGDGHFNPEYSIAMLVQTCVDIAGFGPASDRESLIQFAIDQFPAAQTRLEARMHALPTTEH